MFLSEFRVAFNEDVDTKYFQPSDNLSSVALFKVFLDSLQQTEDKVRISRKSNSEPAHLSMQVLITARTPEFDFNIKFELCSVEDLRVKERTAGERKGEFSP